VTLPPAAQWSVKNSLEFKSARRVLVSGNILENNWVAAQKGFAVVLTVRTSDSGNIAVVDDITIENNVLKNVASGINTLEHDDQCKLLTAPLCNNSGEAKRWRIVNNALILRSADARSAPISIGFQASPGLADVAFQHNTVVGVEGVDCPASLYFGVSAGKKWPLAESSTHNMWVTDNVLCHPPTGDFGGQGTSGLTSYMGDPPPVDKRFTGNVMLAAGDQGATLFPLANLVTAGPVRFARSRQSNYQLIAPMWTKTTDGKQAGVDAKALAAATAGVASETQKD
jgi:hypothetical protein